MKIKFIYCFFLAFLILDACIEPFDINIGVARETIVVDGLLTDQPGPHTVQIFKSSDLNDQLNSVYTVNGATVVLKDDQGVSQVLRETSPGKYQTLLGFQPIMGRSYHIEFTLSENEHFESTPEMLTPVGDIQNLYYEFEQKQDPSLEDQLNPRNGFNVYIDAALDPVQSNLVRWRTTGTFQIHTFPESKMEAQSGAKGAIVMVPAPPPCSGWSYKPTTGLRYVKECTCCDCWVSQYDQIPQLADEQLISENEVKRHQVLFVPAGRRFFHKKYYVEVEQMSVSQTAFDFWESVKKQKETSSDLFQTPSGKTAGNIKSTGTTKTPVVGLFEVSAVKRKSLFIEPSAVPYPIHPIDTVAEACTQIYRNASATKPSFWQ
jgi:hypothetical protein